jgi:lipoprotein LprG
MQRRPGALVVIAALVLAPTACSGDDKTSANKGTPDEVIAGAKTKLDDTSGVEILLSTGELPEGITAIKKATGVGVHPSAFEGDLDLNYTGLPTSATVIAVDGTTYIKNALLFPDWTEFDTVKNKTPDPATLMTPDKGFSALLGASTDLTQGDRARCSKNNTDEADSYDGTVTGDAMSQLIPGSEGEFDVTYRVNDDGQLCGAELTGDFYGEDNGELTYLLELNEYGTKKDITKP